jgi:hypothetical protein
LSCHLFVLSCIAWHCGKPSPSIPQVLQSKFFFLFWPS